MPPKQYFHIATKRTHLCQPYYGFIKNDSIETHDLRESTAYDSLAEARQALKAYIYDPPVPPMTVRPWIGQPEYLILTRTDSRILDHDLGEAPNLTYAETEHEWDKNYNAITANIWCEAKRRAIKDCYIPSIKIEKKLTALLHEAQICYDSEISRKAGQKLKDEIEWLDIDTENYQFIRISNQILELGSYAVVERKNK
jgi:hypothetical protein